jgi:hypothetical protein
MHGSTIKKNPNPFPRPHIKKLYKYLKMISTVNFLLKLFTDCTFPYKNKNVSIFNFAPEA